MFDKLLVANRGEIAVRVVRACRELGVKTVAVYSEADRAAKHVLYADEAYAIGPAASTESYLRIDRLLDVAERSEAQAVHPGYGFLAENGDFAEACEEAGLIFVGPNSRAIRLLGSKTEARKTMIAAGVPVIPGMEHGASDTAEALAAAHRLGFPVMLKAAAGGGGKGMRAVDDGSSFASAYASAQAEAAAAFGDPTVYVEKYIRNPRHIEFQVLADKYGRAIHLNERECSIQRRHQKLIEESPSPLMTGELRAQMGEVAVRAALASGYTNAGTVEFLVDQDRRFYFMEVNARLQVEHPVTELVTGLDLVQEQLRIAAGEPLRLTQSEVRLQGAAIEARISAEDPYEDFVPSGGIITHMAEPGGPGVRVDSGLVLGQEVSLFYDPLLAKLVAWGQDRAAAIERMRRALGEYEIGGIRTTIPFHQYVMAEECFRRGNFDTGYVEAHFSGMNRQPSQPMVAAVLAALAEHTGVWTRPASGTKGVQHLGDPWRESIRTSMLRGSRG
jgi:acetyl-CoA carboxylase, biotin carboxylase subunit